MVRIAHFLPLTLDGTPFGCGTLSNPCAERVGTADTELQIGIFCNLRLHLSMLS